MEIFFLQFSDKIPHLEAPTITDGSPTRLRFLFNDPVDRTSFAEAQHMHCRDFPNAASWTFGLDLTDGGQGWVFLESGVRLEITVRVEDVPNSNYTRSFQVRVTDSCRQDTCVIGGSLGSLFL